jgi:formylglycine-generating enzyme
MTALPLLLALWAWPALAEPPEPTGRCIPQARAAEPILWVAIKGGTFRMGADDAGADPDSSPVREVAVGDFQASRTLVTVEQYAECVSRCRCSRPRIDLEPRRFCNWGMEGREKHPINCVTWRQAKEFAAFKGARLLTEAEWEYAATSGGDHESFPYPWGTAAPSCGVVVMYDAQASQTPHGCGRGGTMPVCSGGNTPSGLCDMAGNVWQWMEDVYRPSYAGAPADGSAVDGPGDKRVLRGGSFVVVNPKSFRGTHRAAGIPDNLVDGYYGLRLAR